MTDCFTESEHFETVESTLAKLLGQKTPVVKTERIAIEKALGRVLAQTVRSEIDIPPQDNSAMDGFALASLQTPGNLPISQRITAGSVPKPLSDGTTARIFTGGFMPKGADSVVMQEDVVVSGKQATIAQRVKAGAYVRYQGEDVKKGAVVLNKGKRIRPQDIAMLASLGIADVLVYQMIVVALLSTGSELINPGEKLTAGKIYNSNRYALIGLLTEMPVKLLDLGIVPDSLSKTKKVLMLAAEKADLILSTGGVSVGEEDHIKNAVSSLGQLNAHKVRMKPGKPFVFGKINKTFFLGLPGNPVSTFVVFNLFVRPFLWHYLACDYQLKTQQVIADFQWCKKGDRREYVRAKLDNGKAVLYHTQSSGALSSTVWADGLVSIKENETVKRGDSITFIAFNQWGC